MQAARCATVSGFALAAALGVTATGACAAAAAMTIDIRPCTTPLWLQIDDAAGSTQYTLAACGAGGVEVLAGSEHVLEAFGDLELEDEGDSWTASWSEPGRDRNAMRRQVSVRADRRPVPLANAPGVTQGPTFQLTLWPRHAPHDLRIHADATADQILREVARVAGITIEGIDMVEPERLAAQFNTIDRRALIEFLSSGSANLFQVGPDHYWIGVAPAFRSARERGEDLTTLSSEDFLQAVMPREAGDFPQPALDLLIASAMSARKSGKHGAAIDALRSAAALLDPYPAAEPAMRLRIGVELSELRVATGQTDAALAGLPSIDVERDDTDLVLRALAVRLLGAEVPRVVAELERVSARLDALPDTQATSERVLWSSVRAAAFLADGKPHAAATMQAIAVDAWRALPYSLAFDFEPGPQVRRQLLRNEIALANAALARAEAGIVVAEWLEQMGGEPSSDELRRLKLRLNDAP